jgi:hypothetical protein
MSGWKDLVYLLNKGFETDHKIFTRKELLLFRTNGWIRRINVNTLDCIRNYLQHAGYLRTISWGKYEVIKSIPVTLTNRQCRREAYGYKGRF